MEKQVAKGRNFIIVSAALMGLVACGSGESKPAEGTGTTGSSGGMGANPCMNHDGGMMMESDAGMTMGAANPCATTTAPATQTAATSTTTTTSTNAAAPTGTGATTTTTTTTTAPAATTTTTPAATTTTTTGRRRSSSSSSGGMRM